MVLQRLAVDTMEADEEAVRMDLTREHTEGANDILARRDTLIAVNTTLSRFTNVEMENRLCLTLEEQIARCVVPCSCPLPALGKRQGHSPEL